MTLARFDFGSLAITYSAKMIYFSTRAVWIAGRLQCDNV